MVTILRQNMYVDDYGTLLLPQYVFMCTMQSYSETIQEVSFHEIGPNQQHDCYSAESFYLFKAFSIWGSALPLLSYLFNISKLHRYVCISQCEPFDVYRDLHRFWNC